MGRRRSSGHSVEGCSTLGCSTLDWEGIHTILEITVASKAGMEQGLRRKEEKVKASERRQLEAVPSTLELIFCSTGGEGFFSPGNPQRCYLGPDPSPGFFLMQQL